MLLCSIIIISILRVDVMSIDPVHTTSVRNRSSNHCSPQPDCKTHVLSTALDPSRHISPTSYTHILTVPVSYSHISKVFFFPFFVFLFITFLSSPYSSVKMHFIPLLSLQWWSQLLKILPISMKGHLLCDTITDPLFSSSMERQVWPLSVRMHVFIMVVIIFGPFVTDICVPTVETKILCLKVHLMLSCLMTVFRAPGSKESVQTAWGSWETEWVHLCPPYTHPQPFKQSVPFLSVPHIGANVYRQLIISHCLLSPIASPRLCGRREAYGWCVLSSSKLGALTDLLLVRGRSTEGRHPLPNTWTYPASNI